jgi:hypothetical protein
MKAKLLFCLLTACLLLVTACGPSSTEIATQTAVAETTVVPSQTTTPTLTPTMSTLTPTKTNTPTMTPTPTPIPRNNILFRRDFEGGEIGEWSHKGGIWVVEQEPNGNDYMSGSSSSTSGNPAQIQYTYQKTRWTDYALETRVKFIKGHTLYILIRSNVGTGEHYAVALNDYGFSFMRTWSGIGTNIPMRLAPDRWYTIRVEIKGDLLSAYIDNALVQELKLQPPLIDHGGIGFVIDEDIAYFDDIKVWSLK